MTIVRLHRRCRIGRRAAIATTLIVCFANILAAQKTNRNKNDEEKARELTTLMSSKYTFEDLLSGNKEAVALEKQIFALTSDAAPKRRMVSILITLGVKDRVYFDYLVQKARRD